MELEDLEKKQSTKETVRNVSENGSQKVNSWKHQPSSDTKQPHTNVIRPQENWNFILKTVSQAIQNQTDITAETSEKNPAFKRCWYGVLATMTLLGILHMCLLLYAALSQRTNVNILFKTEEWLYMPRIHVCQRLTKMLDPAKLANVSITAEAYYAMEVGLGITSNKEERLQKWYRSLDLELLKKEYEKAVKIHGNIANAYRRFYEKYALTCEQVFMSCNWRPGANVISVPSCCDIFEPVFTMEGGLCFVSKKNSVKIQSMDGGGRFIIGLRYASEVRHNFSFLIDIAEPIAGGQYEFNVDDEMHQCSAEFWKRNEVLEDGGVTMLTLVQKQRAMLPHDRKCVSGEKRLNYFKEYSIGNCIWEQRFINHLDLLTEKRCDLPIFQLTRADLQSQHFCAIDTVLQLLDWKLEWTRMVDSRDLSNDTLLFLADKCNVESNQAYQNISLPPCSLGTLDKLAKDQLPEELQKQIDPMMDQNTLYGLLKKAPSVLVYWKEIEGFLADKCNLQHKKFQTKPIYFENGTESAQMIPNCTRKFLLGLSGYPIPLYELYWLKMMLRLEWNSHPRHLEHQVFEILHDTMLKAERDYNTSVSCLPLCVTDSNQLNVHKDSSGYSEKNATYMIVRFQSSEVEQMEEVERLEWSEYVSLIGGIGMWNGATVLSLFNIFFLVAKAFGYKFFE